MSENETPETEASAAASGDEASSTESAADGQPRRNFMVEFLAAAIGVVVGVVPAITGGLFFLHPLFKGKDEKNADTASRPDAPVKDEKGRLKTSVTLESLPDDGTPLQLKMLDDIVDAWNLFPNQEIGSIWIRKVGDQVLAAGLDFATALSVQHQQGPWEIHFEGIAGNNGDQPNADREGNFWAVVVLPSYWIVDDSLEAAFRFQYQGAEESQGIRLYSRYIRWAGAVDNIQHWPTDAATSTTASTPA